MNNKELFTDEPELVDGQAFVWVDTSSNTIKECHAEEKDSKITMAVDNEFPNVFEYFAHLNSTKNN